MREEHVQHPGRVRVDAHIQEGIEVHATHFHVLHATLAQSVQRTLTAADHALGTDGAVELVFDLQQAGRQLAVAALLVTDADGLVSRVRHRQRFVQRVGIAFQVVVAHAQGRLRIALVTQATHAQRGGVGQVERRVAQGVQAMRLARGKRRGHGGRGTKKHQQQEGMATEVADQRKVIGTAGAGEGPVVVDARDGLHPRAVAMRQAQPVHALGLAHVRAAVVANRDVGIGGQAARHARGPHALVAQRLQHHAVDGGELVEAVVNAVVHTRHQLQLRFAEIGGDVRMGQGRAQGCRMGRACQGTVRRHTQAFLLDATLHATQACGIQVAQSLMQGHSGPTPLFSAQVPHPPG